MLICINLTCCWVKSEDKHMVDSHLAIPWQFHSSQGHIVHRNHQQCDADSSVKENGRRVAFHVQEVTMYCIIKFHSNMDRERGRRGGREKACSYQFLILVALKILFFFKKKKLMPSAVIRLSIRASVFI